MMGKVRAPMIERPRHTNLSVPGGTLTISVGRENTVTVNVKDLIETPNMYWRSLVDGTTYRMPTESKPKVEKRYVMPSELFKMIDYTDIDVIQENTKDMPKFRIGEMYALRTPACDGFEANDDKIYKLIGFDDEFGGVKVDAIIVKQISGDTDNIFTLSKNDCLALGIEYENGLQLFPKTMSWVHVRESIPFDEHKLSSTPRSIIDNTIRHIVLKLEGFKDYEDGYVLSPSGKLIKESQFTNSVCVITKEPVVYGNGHILQDKTCLDVSVVHPKKMLFNHGNFISSDDEVFLHIDLRARGSASYDGMFGVDPRYFDGLDPNKYFEVSWDELGGVTIEEYEEAKKKAAEEAAELARKEEEERKRLVEEAEKAAAEKAKIEALAIERMKKLKINEPERIAMPSFRNALDPISSLDMYIKDVDNYFNGIDKQLDDIMESLEKYNVVNPNRRRSKDGTINMWANAARSGIISQNELLHYLDEVF